MPKAASEERASSVPPDHSSGQTLLDAGWRQGALFQLPGAAHFWNGVSESGEAVGIQIQTREIKASERLILISQDCDIVSSAEPCVEALLVRIKNRPRDRNYLDRITNSYRQFVLDADRGLVADAQIRIQIAKGAFKGTQPEPWTMDEQTQTAFVEWLAGRYDRPPVPEAVFEAVSRPVREVLERMRVEESSAFMALDRSVRRLRIRLPPDDSPPLDVGLIVVIYDEVDAEGADAIESAIESIKQAVADGTPTCNLRIESIPYAAMLLQEFEATRPIDLDYMTDRGTEVLLPSIATEALCPTPCPQFPSAWSATREAR